MCQPLSESDLRAIVAAWNPRVRIEGVTTPAQGYVNAIRVVHTTGPTVVVKAPGAAWQGPKERRLHAHFRAIGVPAPQVLAEGAPGEAVPYSWLVSEYVPGQPWSTVAGSLDLTTMTGLYEQLGDVLGRIHVTTFEAFGDAGAGEGDLRAGPVPELGGIGPFATWRELHDAFVGERLAYLRGTALADLAPAVAAHLEGHRSLIAAPVTPRLLHLDLHGGNIMVANGRITGLLDCEESIVGHNEYDLMRTELAHFRETPPEWEAAFRTAYEAHVPIAPDHRARRRYYEVSRSLVWIRSLSAPGRAGQDRAAAEAHIRRYLGALLGDERT